MELNKAALFSRRLLPGGLDSFFCRTTVLLFGQKKSRLCPRRLKVVDDIIVLERESQSVAFLCGESFASKSRFLCPTKPSSSSKKGGPF